MARLLSELRRRFPQYSSEELLARVLCGEVYLCGERVRDPRRHVDAAAQLELRRLGERGGFVSRGGVKLQAALDAWRIDPAGKVFLDAGASTGGFTDCLLQRGAAAVHSVDVGYNQLDYRLRTNPRVIVHERTNIMHLQRLEPSPHAAVLDLSFRSLSGAAAHVLSLTSEKWGVALLKPQFEWSSPQADFDGVVPPPMVAQIVDDAIARIEADGVGVSRRMESPITGGHGNREFLLLLALA